jgi:hypothetical protein
VGEALSGAELQELSRDGDGRGVGAEDDGIGVDCDVLDGRVRGNLSQVSLAFGLGGPQDEGGSVCELQLGAGLSESPSGHLVPDEGDLVADQTPCVLAGSSPTGGHLVAPEPSQCVIEALELVSEPTIPAGPTAERPFLLVAPDVNAVQDDQADEGTLAGQIGEDDPDGSQS